jgi:hypothetical protein
VICPDFAIFCLPAEGGQPPAEAGSESHDESHNEEVKDAAG